MSDLRSALKIEKRDIDAINDFLALDDNPLVNELISRVEKYGGVREINHRAKENGKLGNLMNKLSNDHSPFFDDLVWLEKQRDSGAFTSVPDYRKKVLGGTAGSIRFDESSPVTLEISGSNFFQWLIVEARKSISKRELMPARYVRVRSMKEQVEDGDICAFAAAMDIIGGSYVQTLDTKGTLLGKDGKPINRHLGGSDTLTGYFGGIGEPNEYALAWIDEILHYYTEYGVPQVLNINLGTVLLGYWLYRLGINIEFKVSVFLGVDNPYSVLWLLTLARLFSRSDGTSPLRGLNLSNSVDNNTVELAAYIRDSLGFRDSVRIEHHITEAYKGIVRQPYDRTGELVGLAARLKNIGAKHEGGIPEMEGRRKHPSDILDYFVSKKEIVEQGLMPELLENYLDKHDALNRSAEILTRNGMSFIAAEKLHSI